MKNSGKVDERTVSRQGIDAILSRLSIHFDNLCPSQLSREIAG